MDAKSALLHGDLKEKVYIHVPQGVSSRSNTFVCRLSQSLYDLKQAPRAWFDKFMSTLRQINFS